LTKFFCFFLFTKRSFFLQLNLLILLTIFPDGRYFMSVTSTMTESLRMGRNQEKLLFNWVGAHRRPTRAPQSLIDKVFAGFCSQKEDASSYLKLII